MNHPGLAVFALALTLPVTAGGCARILGEPPGGTTPPKETSRSDERAQAEADDQAARRAEAELTAARVDGAPPACERACALQATICALSNRIAPSPAGTATTPRWRPAAPTAAPAARGRETP